MVPNFVSCSIFLCRKYSVLWDGRKTLWKSFGRHSIGWYFHDQFKTNMFNCGKLSIVEVEAMGLLQCKFSLIVIAVIAIFKLKS